MKVSSLINFFKWFFAFAVFGIAVYAIYQGWDYLKNLLKPTVYTGKDGKQSTFEKNFPNIAEVKDKTRDFFTPTVYTGADGKQSTFEKYFPNVAEAIDKALGSDRIVNTSPTPTTSLEAGSMPVPELAEPLNLKNIKVTSMGKPAPVIDTAKESLININPPYPPYLASPQKFPYQRTGRK